MEKSIEDVLQPYVVRLLEGLDKGVDLAIEHIPDILKQYIIFEAVISWFLFIPLTVIVPFMVFKLTKREYESTGETIVYLPNMFSIIPITFGIAEGIHAVKATFFPKLFLISEFLNILQ